MDSSGDVSAGELSKNVIDIIYMRKWYKMMCKKISDDTDLRLWFYRFIYYTKINGFKGWKIIQVADKKEMERINNQHQIKVSTRSLRFSPCHGH